MATTASLEAEGQARAYLNTLRISKEDRGTKEPNVTGLSKIGGSVGSFLVPEKKDEDYEAFLENIGSFVFGHNIPLGLVERPYKTDDGNVHTPIKIDLDFRFPPREPFMVDGRAIRVYTKDMIVKFVDTLFKEITNICSFKEYLKEDITFYILEKPGADIDFDKSGAVAKKVKDGIHIVCKDLVIDPILQMYIRKKVIGKMSTVFPEEFFEITSKNEIYDESVIERGGWMLHGNCKQGKPPYSHTFRMVYRPPKEEGATYPSATITKNTGSHKIYDRDLIKILSVRYKLNNPDTEVSIHTSQIEELKKFFKTPAAKTSVRLGRTNTRQLSTTYTDEEEGEETIDGIVSSISYPPEDRFDEDKTEPLKSVAWLVDMLSSKRSQAYNTWLNVGICLRNISRLEGLSEIRRGSMVEDMPDGSTIITDNGMYNLWVEFSRKSPRYVEGEEDKNDWYTKFWMKFDTKTTRGEMLKRPSLRLWAKNDSPSRYDKFIKKDERIYMDAVVATKGSPVDMARFARLLYGDSFICANIAAKEWYEFNQGLHRFVKLNAATTLRQRLCGEIRNKFKDYRDERYDIVAGRRQSSEETEDESQTVRTSDGVELPRSRFEHSDDPYKDGKFKELAAIVMKLGQTAYLNNVITECEHIFYGTYGDEFLKKLDSDITLIGFTNGVFDLKSCIFRNGLPEDMISKSTGYDYIEYDEDSEMVQKIYSVIRKIYRNRDVYEYMFGIMASFLRGENPRQEIYFLNGSGANGKSLLTKWLEKTLGGYSIKGQVSLLTEKRSHSGAANPEIAKLRGTRFVHMEEPEDSGDASINASLLKELTGDTSLTARGLYKEPMEFPITFKITFACNTIPKLPSDPAVWRRVRVIEHTSKFLTKDKKIDDPELEFYREPKYMNDEFVQSIRPHFMSILTHYYEKHWSSVFGKEGSDDTFVEPDAVKEFSKEIQKSNDVVSEYFDKELELFTCIPQDEFETKYRGNNKKIKDELLTSHKILKMIKEKQKEMGVLRVGVGITGNKSHNITTKDIENYLHEVHDGIRKIKLKPTDRNYRYSIREYDTSVDSIVVDGDSDEKNTRLTISGGYM